MQALVLAAGKGTRMKSARPKVLHEILGKPVLGYALDVLAALGVEKAHVVIGSGADQVQSYLKSRTGAPKISVVYQREQKGTGHAVDMARRQLANYSGDVLIWPGDMPLLEEKTLREFMKEHRQSQAAVSVLSCLRVEPKGYGRILRAAGSFCAIREELDASETERRIQEVNTGVYLFRAKPLFEALRKIKPANVRKIKPANAKKEFYLTDTVEVLSQEDQRLEAFPLAKEQEGQGINSRIDLAEAMRIMKNREVQKHMENGVTFVAPEQTYVEPGVKIGADTVIFPWCYIESGVKIGSHCQIGPFAKIRKGSAIDDEAVIGSFVEINRSKIGKRVMAKHLSYLGDAVIGEGTNIGAGTITANYDGKNKHQTRIGKKVLVGSDTVFVAPVNVEDGAKTGAGCVITGGSRVKKGQIVAGIPARPLGKKR
jgi:bifunctional UDP-N-acetylglucosamine pyrophosphorylase / glucosamine-1-phosphate N-acetyltransferase